MILHPQNKLVAYIGIGNANITADNPRGINRGNIPGDDWVAFWKSQQPLVDQGLKRWAIWQPFGRNQLRNQWFRDGETFVQRETNLCVEQFTLARAAGYQMLCDTFVEATKAFLQADKEREVIAYLGTLIGAPEWDANYESVESLRGRLIAELQPYLEAGCSLAFDATASLAANHWFYDFLKALKVSASVYIEAWPLAVAPHLSNLNCIALSEQLLNYKPETIGSTFLNPAQITGERQAWLVNHLPSDWPKGYAAWCKKIVPAMLADPSIDSVGFYAMHYVKDGGQLDCLQERDTDWRGMLK